MTPVTVKVFCAHIGGQSQQPGLAMKGMRLQSVPGSPAGRDGKVATPSPNAGIFKDGEGHIGIDFGNITKEFAGAFEEGKSYTVTITEDPAK